MTGIEQGTAAKTGEGAMGEWRRYWPLPIAGAGDLFTAVDGPRGFAVLDVMREVASRHLTAWRRSRLPGCWPARRYAAF